VTQLARLALSRWGPCLRADLRSYVRRVWGELGEGEHEPTRALEDLELLGEVQLVRSSLGPVLVPREQVGIPFGARVALLGTPQAGEGWPAELDAQGCDELPLSAHVHWLAEASWEGPRVSLREWLMASPPPTLELGACWELGSADEVREALRGLWRALCQRGEARGGPVSDGAPLSVLAGGPGDFAGRASEPGPAQRWRSLEDTPDGVWCRARPGQGSSLVPGLVCIDGGRARWQWDLTCPTHSPWELLWWAALGRGHAVTRTERLERRGAEVAWSLPLPRALARVPEAFAASRQGTSWRVELADAEEAAAVCEALSWYLDIAQPGADH